MAIKKYNLIVKSIFLKALKYETSLEFLMKDYLKNKTEKK